MRRLKKVSCLLLPMAPVKVNVQKSDLTLGCFPDVK